MKSTDAEGMHFGGGSERTGFCQVPNYFLDFQLITFTHAELKVILYINRRTTGFQKRFDAISYSQFVGGICSKDGHRLDYGTGLSRKSVQKALDSLVSKGAIFRHPRRAANGACLPTIYEMNLDGKPSYQPGPEPESGIQPVAGVIAGTALPTLPPIEIEPVAEPDAEPGTNPDPEPDTSTGGNSAPGTRSITSRIIDTGPGMASSLEADSSYRESKKYTGGYGNNNQGVGVKSSPATGVKSSPTIDSVIQNKVKQNTNQSGDDLRQGILEAGVWDRQAARLADIARANHRDRHYLDDWTAWLKRQPAIHNQGAYLAKVIETNAELPGIARPRKLDRPAFGSPEYTRRYQEQHHRRTAQLAASVSSRRK